MGATDETEAADFARRFRQALAELPLAHPPRRWLVGFSGGLDSTLLLNSLRQAEPAARIVAVHVDHGLQADSADWSAHCAAAAATLGVGFVGLRARIEPSPAASLEAAAREARYAALAGVVESGDVLLTAHHADDQLETLLLRLMRGSGVRGLTGIGRCLRFAEGWLARPLLGFTRAEIRIEAGRLGLAWLEDPSNADPRFDRNYLRATCLPPLLARWPRAGTLASRLARQMAEAEQLLGELAEQDLGAAADPACLPLARLALLSAPKLNNALRHAVRRLGLPPPSAVQLKTLRRALAAREDAETVVTWPGAEARLYRGHLYLLEPRARAEPVRGRVSAEQPLALIDGELRLVVADDYGIPDRWARAGLDVDYRQGGERFRPQRSRQHKSLKHWFQESGIVPWMRSSVPLLYHGDRLVAVADLCLADDLPQADADAPFWRPVWTGHPRLR